MNNQEVFDKVARHLLELNAKEDSVTATAENFTTRRAAWRKGLETAKTHATGDDVTYWAHELRVFDRSFDHLWALMQAPPAQVADSVLGDAACWHWIAEYLVGTRTDLDDEIVASETVNDLRKLVDAARKQGGVNG